MLGLPCNIVGGFDNRGDVMRCITRIRRIGAVGNPDHMRTRFFEAGDQLLDVGNQQIIDTVKPILSGLTVALFR